MSVVDRHRRQSVYANPNVAPNVTTDYDYNIGARVLVHGENPGVVRFVGITSFQKGRWIGVELDDPKGKNAGVVQGKRYFDCKPQHGVFVRPAQIKLLTQTSNYNGRRKSVYNNNSGNGELFSGSLSSSLAEQQQHQSYMTSTSQQQQRVAPTISTRQLSTQPSTKSTTLSPTMKKRPTSLINGDTPRASITITASTQNRRKSMSVRQQQQQRPVSPKTPTTVTHSSTQSSISHDSSYSTDASSPIALARDKQLQALKMKHLQQLQLEQQRQEQHSLSSSPQSSDMEYSDEEDDDEIHDDEIHDDEIHDDEIHDDEIHDDEIHDDEIHDDENDDEEEYSDDSMVDQYTEDDDNDLLDEASITDSDHLTEQDDMDSGIDEQHEQQPWTSQMSRQQVYGALATTKPTSKSDQVVPLKDYEELRLKFKILEAKRQEDRERLREHEKIKEEAEQFLTLRNKLQDKIADLQKDVRVTKRELKDALAGKELFEAKYIDAFESLEMMTLDKEVAEERAESLLLEVTLLTDKIEEISVDLDIVRKETGMTNQPLDLSGDHDGKTSLEVVQLERHNERLKEALIRLRDATIEKEAQLSSRIKDLERDCCGFDDLKEQCARYKEKVEIAEYQIEDLKQQLDDALGTEDLVDQLTEKNLNLNEKMDEMRATVDDLEALKELADELEENHVETEKQLQAEIDHRDLLLREQLERLKSSEETAADYESTIQQFRELVALLQSDLEQLRQKQENQAYEKHNLSSQSQAMMSLNLQLQSTVMKAQAKSIDLELRKLDGAQATERLGYIQPYLPDAFFKTENDPISCLLLFKRLVFKSDLIIKHLDQNHPISEKIVEDVSECLVTVCEMRQKAGWLGDLAKRFVNFIKHCKPDVFVKMCQVYHDLLGTERRLNVIVELFRTNDVTEAGCLHELHRIISQLEHLTEAYLGQYGEPNNAEQFFALTRALDFNADRMTVEFTYIQQLVEKANKVEDIPVVEGSVCLDVDYLEPLTRLIVQAKNSKISAKKLLRQLEDLSEEALTLRTDHLHRFKTLYAISSKICNFCYDLCHQITVYVDTKRGSRESISIKAIQQIVREKADEILDLPESTLWEASLKILKSLTSELASTLTRVENDHKKDKIATSISPWIQRASDMKAEVMMSHDLEQKLQQHNDEIIRLIKDVKIKDQSLQEASVKVDLLERRMEFAKKESEQISQLESALEKAHDQEQMYMEAMDSLQAEYDLLEQENMELKKDAAKKEETRQSLLKKFNYDDMCFTSTDIRDDSPAGYKTMDSHMKTLKAAIRYLRSENAQLKSQDLANSLRIQQLPEVIQGDTSSNSTERAQRIQNMATQTRNLLKDVRMASACPSLVELSPPTSTNQWQSIKKSPNYQFQTQQSALYTLKKRTQQLHQNIQAMTHEQDVSSSLSSIATVAQNLSSSSIRKLAKIKIPLPQIMPPGSTKVLPRHNCVQIASIQELDRIHSLFIH